MDSDAPALSPPPREPSTRGEPRLRFAEEEHRSYLGETVRERLGKRRFYALAAAIREHEAETRINSHDLEPHDAELYRRLRMICGEL
jgi:hypothetical protein